MGLHGCVQTNEARGILRGCARTRRNADMRDVRDGSRRADATVVGRVSFTTFARVKMRCARSRTTAHTLHYLGTHASTMHANYIVGKP